MLAGYPNRASWKSDDELEMLSILRVMGLDQLREAKRLIAREISRREAAGPELHALTDADKALFKNG